MIRGNGIIPYDPRVTARNREHDDATCTEKEGMTYVDAKYFRNKLYG